MATPRDAFYRDELLDRRRRLELAIGVSGDTHPLERLMSEVDAALARIEDGSYGICETCHDAIEPERLAADPLLCLCIDHLTQEQRTALEQDLESSARIQGSLLPPREIRHADLELAYRYESFGPVSGDYCDVIPTSDGGLICLLGDVAGKGVAASLLMTHLHAIFRSLAPLDLSVAELMSRANRIFCDALGGERYATLACCRIRPNGEAELSVAGHCPPLRWAGSEITSIVEGSLPLGLFCGAPFGASRLVLAPGDGIVLYTDGITESRDASGEEYGEERLVRAVAGALGGSASQIVRSCLEDLASFCQGVPRRDDLTLLVLRRERAH